MIWLLQNPSTSIYSCLPIHRSTKQYSFRSVFICLCLGASSNIITFARITNTFVRSSSSSHRCVIYMRIVYGPRHAHTTTNYTVICQRFGETCTLHTSTTKSTRIANVFVRLHTQYARRRMYDFQMTMCVQLISAVNYNGSTRYIGTYTLLNDGAVDATVAPVSLLNGSARPSRSQTESQRK